MTTFSHTQHLKLEITSHETGHNSFEACGRVYKSKEELELHESDVSPDEKFSRHKVEVTVQNKLHYCRKFSRHNSSMKSQQIVTTANV